jgi:hypothetical protein
MTTGPGAAARVTIGGAGHTAVRAVAATLVLFLVLIQPNHPAAMTWGALRLFPLELPVILLMVLALGAGWAGILVRAALVAALVTIALAKAADYGTFIAFNRPFNALVDMHLVHAAWMLGSGSVGVVLAALAVAGALGVLVALAAALWWALAVWARLSPGRAAARLGAGLAAVPFAALAVAEIGQAQRLWSLPFDPPGAAFTARVGYERAVFYRAALADLEEFRRIAARDPFLASPPTQVLDRIGGRDVLVVFVESYGRSSFDNPLYAPTHTATLADFEARLSDQGLAMRSAYLTAAMVGGQSWLSHGAVASGLWLDNQRRYQALLASPRRTLYHYAQGAGFETAAVMPAIVMDWPEANFFGFDTILPFAALGYEGERFNWITQPDQFTMVALDRLLRDGAPRTQPEAEGRAPLFAQVALISSHAPWVPVPDLIPWEDVRDGTEFNEMALSDDPPEVVWRDHDRVRDQFRRAVDYTLQVVGSYAERQARIARDTGGAAHGPIPLMVVLGDHEPAPFVSGVDGFDVPVHLIGPPEVLALVDAWGWTPGLVPARDAPVWRIDTFRDRFMSAFSTATLGELETGALAP